MAKIIKNNLGNFLIICLIFLMMTVWIFAGKPQIWKKPAFPPEIQKVWADDQTFTETGAWNVPVGVTEVTVEVRGGGAGGGQGQVAPKAERSGGGGGGGAFTRCTCTVIPEQNYNVTVGVLVGTDTNGNPSDFTGEDGTCTANGGTTGANTAGGAGGTAQTVAGIVTHAYAGGAAGNGDNAAGSGGGGGGEGAGSTATGGAGGNGDSGGAGAGGTGGTGTDGGDGGAGGNNGAAGAAGTIPGGGGGGAGSDHNTGGNGERGQVYLSWTVTAVYSVTVADGAVAYGVVALNGQKTTLQLDPVDTQIATNNEDTAKFNIKTTIATGGGTDWALVTSTGAAHQFIHKFSTNGGGNWITFQNTDYYSLAYDIVGSDTQAFDLFIGMPSSTDDYGEKSITVTVQAVDPSP